MELYQEIIDPILANEKVQEMRQYINHGEVDCLSHCLRVSHMAYQIGKRLHMDYVALARAGMLHDFYLYDWHIKGDRKGLHGFTHAKTALENAESLFELTNKEKDMIRWHMWPLNIGVPRFKETWILMLADRFCTVLEVLRISSSVRRFDK